MAGMNQLQLTDVLSSPVFATRVVEVSDLTTDGFEAGFAVYHGDSSNVIMVSDVQHPDTNYIEAMEAYELRRAAGIATPEARLTELMIDVSDSDDPATMLPHLDVGRLITDEADGTSMRTDLAFVGHSHPLLHAGKRPLATFLLPSPSDIVYFGDHAADNPDLIEGVMVTHSKLGGIALRLWKGHGDFVQRIQAVEEQSLGNAVSEQKLAALGLSTAVVTFNRHSGKIQPKSLEGLDKLYTPPAA